MSLTVPFDKMQGIGNDFVMLDALRHQLPEDLTELSRWANDRHFGIGGDGLIVLEKGDDVPFRMRMFNPDGSESEMCGNGIRCLAKFIESHGHSDLPSVPIETGAGLLHLELLPNGQVQVDMGIARITRSTIGLRGEPTETFIDQPVDGDLRGTAVSMGNPHLVIFVENVASVPIEEWGPKLEHHSEFPNRTNVHFVQFVNRGNRSGCRVSNGPKRTASEY
jgi:diaminopimelate epimerase